MASVEEIVAAVIKALDAQKAANPARRDDDKKRIDDRHLKLEDFQGKAEDWADWSFTFKRMIKGKNEEAWRIMNEVEKANREDMEAMALTEEQKKIGSELYDILCQVGRGDARTVVRKVDDFDGFKVWHEMFAKYNPRTMGRMLRLLTEVIGPAKISNIGEVVEAMDNWEGKIMMLVKEFQAEVGELRDPIKIAILTNMLPIAIQEHIFTHVQKTASYKDVSEMVKTFVTNKIAMGPMMTQKMDLGNVDKKNELIGEWYPEEEWDVDAVGYHIKCHSCGEGGHLARECPSKGGGKGKGKNGYFGGKGFGGKDHGKGFGGKDYGKGFGGKDYGKGFGGKDYGKGFGGKDYGKGFGGKDYGKGYKGTCFNCGEVGHKRWECTKAIMSVEEQESKDEPTHIGGVWMIGNVECEWEVVKSSSRTNRLPPGLKQDLQEDEGMVCMVCNVENQCAEKLTRPSAMDFHEADVKKPLASAACVTRAGNRIILDDQGGVIENKETGEKMQVKIENGVYVYEVQMESGEMVKVTLDSGAGCNVWPRGLQSGAELRDKKEGMRMVAANGTDIKNYGRRLVRFRGVQAQGFAGRM